MRKTLSKPLAFLITSLAVSRPLIAQVASRFPARMPHDGVERGSPVRPPATFGTTEYSVTSVFSASFASFDSSQRIATNHDSYRFFSSASSTQYFMGSVNVPAGVVIDYLGINNCDPSAAGGTYVFQLMDSTSGINYTQIGEIQSLQNSCAVEYNASALNYQYPANAGHNLQIYVISAAGAPTDGSAGVQSVEVWWRRQVSPAPATADFNDVPTSHPFFQFIEALYQSGITAGCGAGNYCPDSAVTRGQMAAFLAKALGLNWPEGPVP